MQKFYGFISIILILLTSAVFSQESTDEDSQNLAPVTVTGTGTEKRLSDSPVVTEIIGEAEIEASGAQTLDEVLEDYGVLYTSSDGHGDYLQLQGIGGSGVLLLIDGRRVNGRIARRYETAAISLSDVLRIEIIRGPQSALYGSDAMGGVINIITKNDGEALEYRLNLENVGLPGYDDVTTDAQPTLSDINALAEQQATLNIDIPGKTFGLGIDLHGGYSSGYFDEDGEKTITPAYLLGRSGLDVTVDLTDRLDGEMGTGISMYRQDDQTDFTGSLDRVNILRSENYVHANYYPGDVTLITANAYYNYYYREASSYVAGTDTWGDASEYDRQNYVALDIKADTFVGDMNLLTIGFEVTGDWLESPDINTEGNLARRNTQSVYIQDEVYRDALFSVVTGLRGERNSQYGYWATPKVSAMYYLTPELRLLGGVGMGYHAPDFNDLYVYMTEDYGVSHPIIEGNENLDPEYSVSFNTGAELVYAKWDARLNLFHHELFNEIAAQLTGETYEDGRVIYQYQNVSRSLRSGVDAEFQYGINEYLSTSLSYGYVFSYDRQELTRLFDQPSHVLRGRFSFGFPSSGFSGNLGLLYYSPLEPADQLEAGEEELGEHRFTLSFYSEKQFGDDLSVYLKLDNLTGYTNESLGPYVPQQLSIGLRLSGGREVLGEVDDE